MKIGWGLQGEATYSDEENPSLADGRGDRGKDRKRVGRRWLMTGLEGRWRKEGREWLMMPGGGGRESRQGMARPLASTNMLMDHPTNCRGGSRTCRHTDCGSHVGFLVPVGVL